MIEAGLLGKRMELIRGLIIKKMPKSPLHSYAATELCRRIEDAVEAGDFRHGRSAKTGSGKEIWE